MSLLDEFKKIEKDEESYYYKKIRFKEVISNPSRSWDFIREYFKAGEKESVLESQRLNELKTEGKHLHTVSMYFLGVLLKDFFIRYDNKNSSFKYYEFTYTWFITCLFHDFSWIHEKKEINLDPNSSNDFNDYTIFENYLINEFNIQHSIFEHKLVCNNNFETHYSQNIIVNYFDYKYHERDKLDHGIIAGVLLFDRLLKNYNNKWENYKDSYEYANQKPSEKGNYNNFFYKNKSWKREHHDHFAYIADSIISHNIWLSSNEELYSKYNLQGLLRINAEKISINRNPLLFMLGILDTIEPVKVFTNFDAEYVWDNINIYINSNSIEIIVKERANFNHHKWFKKISSLNEWLAISIEEKRKKLKLTLI